MRSVSPSFGSFSSVGGGGFSKIGDTLGGRCQGAGPGI